ncbi:MAG: hypothetical protein Ta2E_09990 [Mycoplasmoidaceae bacterium]|nr:MAG: hypothetical protein Ta2E_09990 [Mycoplasmoidaceae bacterium]
MGKLDESLEILEGLREGFYKRIEPIPEKEVEKLIAKYGKSIGVVDPTYKKYNCQ